MKLEVHKAHFRESVEALDIAVERGVAQRQRTVGFNTSAASMDLLSLYLFREELITPGTQIQHQWFRSRRLTQQHLAFDFPNE